MKQFLIFAVLFSFAIAAPAQTLERFSGYAGVGFSSPTGSFGDRHDIGWSALGGAGFKLTPHISLNGEYNFNRFGYQFATPGANQLLNGDTMIHGFTFNPRITSSGPVRFYATAGYGIYNRRFELQTPSVTTGVPCDPYLGLCTGGLIPTDFARQQLSTWKQGWNAGGGMEFGGKVKFFTDVRYHWIATPDVRTHYLPINFGVRF